MGRIGIAFDILLWAQVAYSSLFSAEYTPNSQYCGRYSSLDLTVFLAGIDQSILLTAVITPLIGPQSWCILYLELPAGHAEVPFLSGGAHAIGKQITSIVLTSVLRGPTSWGCGCPRAFCGRDNMSRSIVLDSAVTMVDLEPSPISPDWILSGKPEARSKLLAKSHDGTSYVVVWECSAGRFEWHYTEDETVTIILGEVFITEKGGERRLGQGDMAFFPAGSSCVWRVADRVRKVAVMRKTLGYPLGFCVRAWYKLLRMAGLSDQSPLIPAVLPDSGRSRFDAAA
jgi:uncharacterized protein